MDVKTVELIDESGNLLATVQVIDEGGYYGGTIDLASIPVSIRALFEEFEEIVDNQMFIFLDEIQEQIDSLFIKAVFENRYEAHIKDLQVFPSTGEVSFKLAETPAPRQPEQLLLQSRPQ